MVVPGCDYPVFDTDFGRIGFQTCFDIGWRDGWKALADADLPAMFYISKLDEEHANFFGTFDSLRETFGASVIPFTFPILKGEEAVGIVDLVAKKAYDASGKEIPLPADAADRIEEYMMELNEQVAETDEELMEKFFMEEPFTDEEMARGIKEGLKQRAITPVFCGCAMSGLGTTALIENIIKYAIPIGRATADIPAGSWVHLHVMRSNYDERSSHLDVRTGAPKDTKYE